MGSVAVSGPEASPRMSIKCPVKVYFGASNVLSKCSSLFVTSQTVVSGLSAVLNMLIWISWSCLCVASVAKLLLAGHYEVFVTEEGFLLGTFWLSTKIHVKSYGIKCETY